MKSIGKVMLVIIFAVIVIFCLYIAPNYKKTGNEGKTNLVINYKNVTGKMKGRVINVDNNVYLAIDDIENYYDRHIYFDKQYNYIVAAGNGCLACFDINNGRLDLNGKNIDARIIKEDELYYVPITELQDLYNIRVNYKEATNTVVIESLDRAQKVASTNKEVSVKSKATLFSKTLEKLNADSTVCMELDNSGKNGTEVVESISSSSNVSQYIAKLEADQAKEWTYIRTENGTLGYVKNSELNDIKTISGEKENNAQSKTISLVWEYYEEQYGSAPQNDDNIKYDGVNVVSPAFFYMEGSAVRENVGEAGENYLRWAKSNNYEVWARVANNNITTEDMKAFSEWINDYKKRQNVIVQIVNYAKKYGLEGINIDFENMYKEDKDSLSRFIIELKPRLERINVKLSADVTEPDGSDNWSLCYDRNVIGEVADYIVFMAYDQTAKSSKKPGSVAAYNWVERNLKKFIDNEGIDPGKIILGVPFYTRLWKVNKDGISESASNIIMKDQQKYIDRATTKQWLDDARQNYIEYSDDSGYIYKMWVEDEDSIGQKLNLVQEYKLAGVAFWQKGNEVESIWSIIKKKLL